MSTETATVPEAPHAEAHAAHDDHGKRPYMAIFWGLLVLTIFEVSTIFIPIPENLHLVVTAPLLMVIAIGKAALVAAYYMHLRYDPRWLVPVFVGPFALAILFGVIILIQY